MKINLTEIHVGVDVSKNQLDVYLYPISKAFVFANSENGIKKMIEQFSTYSIGQIVCESTGGYEALMLKMLRKSGYKVWQTEPSRIKSFIRSKGKKAKTDSIDARMMALFAAQEVQEHEYIDYGKDRLLLNDLVNRKKDLTDMIVAEKLRLQHPGFVSCAKEIKEHITFMKNQLKKLEHKIQQLIDNNDAFKAKLNIIESVPGIGKATAAVLISKIPELGSIENKQAAALVGVAPYTRQSGQYKGKALISGGRVDIRSSLFVVALVAIRYNSKMKEFYHRLHVVQKKPAKVALVAVMRKLIVCLNVMIKNQTEWRYA